MPDTFQRRFKKAMEIREMKQKDVAEKSGLHKAQISQYATGKYEPMQDALYKIAKALNVNVAWLMGHDVPMEVVSTTELEKKVAICDLIEQCYGKEAYTAVQMFLKLDTYDQAIIVGEMRGMLHNEKYSAKEKSLIG